MIQKHASRGAAEVGHQSSASTSYDLSFDAEHVTCALRTFGKSTHLADQKHKMASLASLVTTSAPIGKSGEANHRTRSLG
jgi:hypothetical protein